MGFHVDCQFHSSLFISLKVSSFLVSCLLISAVVSVLRSKEKLPVCGVGTLSVVIEGKKKPPCCGQEKNFLLGRLFAVGQEYLLWGRNICCGAGNMLWAGIFANLLTFFVIPLIMLKLAKGFCR